MRHSLALAAAAVALLLGAAAPAPAQTPPATPPAAAAAPATGAAAKPPAKGKKSKKSKKTDTAPATPAAAPGPTAPQTTTTVTIKQKETAPAPSTTPAAPVQKESDYNGPPDDDAPTIAHTAISKALKGRPLTITAHIVDPAGVFQPALYLRKRGTGDYIPIRMNSSKTVAGDYWVEVDAKLMSVDLEYYIECWDNAGNGPARSGTPEQPFFIKIEEEKRAPAPLPAALKVKGAPPSISHSAVGTGVKGNPIEISAKLLGETGVSLAKVMFRRVGEKDYKELPMGDIGEENYTATMPASMVTGDVEYYIEAFDKFGNGPGRSGDPKAPYKIVVTEKVDTTKVIIAGSGLTPNAPPVENRPPPPPAPKLVKVGFKPNPGRWAGYLAMGGFVAGLTFAGGELYGSYQANEVYKHTFNYDGRLLPGLHDRAQAYSKRAEIFGIAAAGALVLGITLLVIFPEHPETMVQAGSGGDLVVAKF